jgi:hypothetical protein
MLPLVLIEIHALGVAGRQAGVREKRSHSIDKEVLHVREMERVELDDAEYVNVCLAAWIHAARAPKIRPVIREDHRFVAVTTKDKVRMLALNESPDLCAADMIR